MKSWAMKYMFSSKCTLEPSDMDAIILDKLNGPEYKQLLKYCTESSFLNQLKAPDIPKMSMSGSEWKKIYDEWSSRINNAKYSGQFLLMKAENMKNEYGSLDWPKWMLAPERCQFSSDESYSHAIQFYHKLVVGCISTALRQQK